MNINYTLVLKLLDGALEHLWDGTRSPSSRSNEFVCCCIDKAQRVMGLGRTADNETDYLRTVIDTYMDGSFTFNGYYEDKHSKPGLAVELQAGRRAMIAAIREHVLKLAVLQTAKVHSFSLEGTAGFDGHSRFACLALAHAYQAIAECSYSEAYDHPVCKELRKGILKQLNGESVYELSLPYEVRSNMTAQQLQAGRQGLIATLLTEYEALPVKPADA